MSLEFSFLLTKIHLLSSLSLSTTVLQVLAARAAFHFFFEMTTWHPVVGPGLNTINL